MSFPAIITAGDLRAAKAVYGESKVYLEVEGVPLVSRVVQVLQRVPEVTEVWVIGDAARLESVLSAPAVQAILTKPLHVIEQGRNLFENCWESYRRALPGAPPEGRDPVGDDLDFEALYLSGDLPFATPQEISEFIRQGQEADCDYAAGLVTKESLASFLPTTPGGIGIDVAYFNMVEGRLRQSNLHLAKPGRMGARELIEEMYEHRHQKRVWNMLTIGAKLATNQGAGPSVVFWYSLIHLSGLLDRWGMTALADWVRKANTISRTERVLGRLLQTRFRFLVTEVGGCAIDVDTEEEYDAVKERFQEWSAQQEERAKAIYGQLPSQSGGAPPAKEASEAGEAGEKGEKG
jgi:GTP:adenosylcobinamide-phosphate guanylyltransferase